MLEDEHRTFTKGSLKPIRNTQCTFSNYSCGFIKVPYTVKRKQFHSSHYRRVFKICYHKSNLKYNSLYSDQSNLRRIHIKNWNV